MLILQSLGQSLVVLPELFDVGGVIEGDEDGIVFDSHVPFEAGQERLGQMAGIPAGEGFSESASQLMQAGRWPTRSRAG